MSDFDAEKEAQGLYSLLVGGGIGQTTRRVEAVVPVVMKAYRSGYSDGLERAAKEAEHWTGSLWTATDNTVAKQIVQAIRALARKVGE